MKSDGGMNGIEGQGSIKQVKADLRCMVDLGLQRLPPSSRPPLPLQASPSPPPPVLPFTCPPPPNNSHSLPSLNYQLVPWASSILHLSPSIFSYHELILSSFY